MWTVTESTAPVALSATPDDLGLEALERRLGPRAAVDVRRLSGPDGPACDRAVLRRASDGGLRLGPRAVRWLGESALRSVIAQLWSRQDDCGTDWTGGESVSSTRPWGFDDLASRDAARAVPRRSGEPPPGLSDLEVTNTGQRGRAAVALCVDTSRSMVRGGRWVPMKRTALALHHLISTRYGADTLRLVTFGGHASIVDIGELTALECAWEQGTNLHHALLLADRHVRGNPGAQPVVLVVTDGEPTGHLEPDGRATFRHPSAARTLEVTLSEMDALIRFGVTLSVFMLGEDERLAAFVDTLARRRRGRVVAPTAAGLGAAVVGDYLRTRHHGRPS